MGGGGAWIWWCDGAGLTSSTPSALTVGAGGGCLDIFTLIYPFSPLSPSLWETGRYRLKYCLKGPINPKQPTNQPKNSMNLLINNPCSKGASYSREANRKTEKLHLFEKRSSHSIKGKL